MLDLRPVRAFLEPAHHDTARAAAAACDELAQLPPADDDGAAREQARVIARTLGAHGLLAPVDPLDLRACCVTRELLGATSSLADAVFALQALGSTPLALAGTAAQKARWLDAVRAGHAIAAFAMTEPDAGSDVASMTTTARRDGSDYVLDGRKTLISNAGIADFYTVFASTDRSRGSRGISAFIVPADAPGLHFAGAQVMSAPHPLGELAFDGCRVPADALIGEEHGGFRIGMATLDRLRPTVAAAACGMAQRALDEALTHARARHQFGERLADFQIVKQKLARMATELTASRLLTYRAAWERDGGAERITLEAAMAKAYATEAAQRIIDDAVQIIGGRGVLADHPVDRLYRAIRALRIYEGTTEIQELVIAGLIVGPAAPREASA